MSLEVSDEDESNVTETPEEDLGEGVREAETGVPGGAFPPPDL